MISLEQEVKAYFRSQNMAFEDNCRSFSRLDFAFGNRQQGRRFFFDAKEKRQPLNMQNWPISTVPQEHLFVLDDLAARKVLAYAPQSGLVIRDNLRQSYHLLTVVDLFLMPKQRVNRPIENEVQVMKGKWLLDLRSSFTSAGLDGIVARVNTYLDQHDAIFFKQLACYGHYAGEEVHDQGTILRPGHWEIDISATR